MQPGMHKLTDVHNLSSRIALKQELRLQSLPLNPKSYVLQRKLCLAAEFLEAVRGRGAIAAGVQASCEPV